MFNRIINLTPPIILLPRLQAAVNALKWKSTTAVMAMSLPCKREDKDNWEITTGLLPSLHHTPFYFSLVEWHAPHMTGKVGRITIETSPLPQPTMHKMWKKSLGIHLSKLATSIILTLSTLSNFPSTLPHLIRLAIPSIPYSPGCFLDMCFFRLTTYLLLLLSMQCYCQIELTVGKRRWKFEILSIMHECN